MNRAAVVAIFVALACNGYLLGQSICKSCETTSVWKPIRLPLNVAHRRVAVSIVGLSASTPWAIGIQPSDRSPSVVVADVVFEKHRLKTIGDWERSKIRLDTGSAQVLDAGHARGSLLVFLNVPMNTQISLSVDDHEVLDKPIGDGILVHKMNPVPQRPTLPRMLALLSSSGARELVQLTEVAPGKFIAPPGILREHLLSYSKPDAPSVSTPQVVTMRFAVDETGRVVRSVSERG